MKLSNRGLYEILWLLQLCTTASFGNAQEAAATAALSQKVKGVIDWVTNKDGGYFNGKQTVRQADVTQFHPASVVGLGVYANADIADGEMLARIPKEAIIADFDGEDEEDDDGYLPCTTIRKLIKEMELGEGSSFAPFVDFLMARPTSSLPSAWSQRAVDLFDAVASGTTRFMQMPPAEPTAWLEYDWELGCDGDRTEMHDHAVLLTLSRMDGEFLVPIFDLYNHNDGDARNVEVHIDEESQIYDIVASKAIKAGQQLFVSYVECPSCQRADSYSTPELFRDYGFIAEYPQRWKFEDTDFDIEQVVFDVIKADKEQIDGKNTYTIAWVEGDDDQEAQTTLKKHLSRLGRMRSDELASGPQAWAIARGSTVVIPQEEWDIIIAFVDAAIIALGNAFYDISQNQPPFHDLFEDSDLFGCLNGGPFETCMLKQLYPTLITEADIIRERMVTCDNSLTLDFSDFTVHDNIQTEYQRVSFFQDNKEGSNMCMDLDTIVQICDDYRPHYHEYAVNYAVRYLPSLKRVAFIGGGDSMILQEVLKYPNLELVIGLELDQVVVRNAFKHFHTQPHFDDDRVEWWFGDATKSLLLLPKEYANSFDFVMVDVSETATSLTVTEHMDILDAMALLVKPDGIMVKNEPYFHQMSTVFDYAVDVHFYNNPMICDQSMIMGSNHINFYRQNLTDHGVENLLLPEIDDYPNDYYFWRDYKDNDPNLDGSCTKLNKAIKGQKEASTERKGKSEGMLMIVDVEKCVLAMDQVEPMIMKTLESLGFSSISSDNNSADSFDVVVVMSEGYVVARRWPEYDYVALDIYLWGRFDLMDATRAELAKALRGGDATTKGVVSSYRVVVSGMYGNDSYERDNKLIGPDLNTHTRKCESQDAETVEIERRAAMEKQNEATGSNQTTIAPTDLEYNQEFMTTALDAIVENMVVSDAIVLVFCGSDGEACLAASILEKSPHISQVVTLQVCAGLENFKFGKDEAEDLEALHSCRRSLEKKIKDVVETGKIIDAAILDSTAPYAMAQIFASFWTFRRTIFQNPVVHTYASVMPDSSQEEWRRNVLVDIRRKLDIDPLARTELVVKSKHAKRSDPAFEMSILNVDMGDAYARVQVVQNTILEKYGEQFTVGPTVLEGGTLMYMDENEYQPIKFTQDDYDLSAEKQQLADQKALGRQSIFQLGRDKKHRDSSPNVDTILSTVLNSSGFSTNSMMVYNDMGDGVVAVGRCDEGNVVAIWDGRDHIVINLFQFNQKRSVADRFMTAYLSTAGEGWGKELRDDMPRGINKVMNFVSDSK